jgi:LacI family transcriptional regulator
MDVINLKGLAEKLNLSVSTVSKAFRNSYDINPETRSRILQLAKELNYQPNALASSLRTQKSKTIAVIIPEIANNFFTLAINGIESIAQKQDYHVLIYLTHEDPAKEISFTRHLQNGRVDGVLMSLSGGQDDYSHIDELKSKGIPLVFFDRVYQNADTAKVTTNDFESGYKATQHLIEQGCRKIGHLYFSKNLSIAEQRMKGYLQALKDQNIRPDKKLIAVCGNDLNQNKKLIRSLLMKAKPDGIFSSFEKLAILTYHICVELKLSIPKDLKIVSFSNLETASLLNPSLTTITQPAFEIGEMAASVLFKALEKKTVNIPNQHIMINSVLSKRRSSEKN